ncbi:MAG: carboxymuconolactone decarboxylase family protein [Candidatus Freyarchaeota archaeon]
MIALALRRLVKQIFESLDESVKDIIGEMRESYGRVPFIADSIAKHKPELLVLDALSTLLTLRKPTVLSPKVAELVAVSAAVALGCEHCTDFHIEAALREGASIEEVFDTILIAGLISRSARLAVGLRVLERVTSRIRRRRRREQH